jgi:hypothetical protein
MFVSRISERRMDDSVRRERQQNNVVSSSLQLCHLAAADADIGG